MGPTGPALFCYRSSGGTRARIGFDLVLEAPRVDTESQLADNEYTVSTMDVLALSQRTGCSAYDCEFVSLAKSLNLKLIERLLIEDAGDDIVQVAMLAAQLVQSMSKGFLPGYSVARQVGRPQGMISAVRARRRL